MANFNRNNLIYTYSKTARQEGDNPNYRGPIDRNKVDRHEEYEVLTVIDAFYAANNWPITNISYGNKIEKLLKAAPSNLTNRQALYNWIIDNWNKN